MEYIGPPVEDKPKGLTYVGPPTEGLTYIGPPVEEEPKQSFQEQLEGLPPFDPTNREPRFSDKIRIGLGEGLQQRYDFWKKELPDVPKDLKDLVTKPVTIPQQNELSKEAKDNAFVMGAGTVTAGSAVGKLLQQSWGKEILSRLEGKPLSDVARAVFAKFIAEGKNSIQALAETKKILGDKVTAATLKQGGKFPIQKTETPLPGVEVKSSIKSAADDFLTTLEKKAYGELGKRGYKTQAGLGLDKLIAPSSDVAERLFPKLALSARASDAETTALRGGYSSALQEYKEAYSQLNKKQQQVLDRALRSAKDPWKLFPNERIKQAYIGVQKVYKDLLERQNKLGSNIVPISNFWHRAFARDIETPTSKDALIKLGNSLLESPDKKQALAGEKILNNLRVNDTKQITAILEDLFRGVERPKSTIKGTQAEVRTIPDEIVETLDDIYMSSPASMEKYVQDSLQNINRRSTLHRLIGQDLEPDVLDKLATGKVKDLGEDLVKRLSSKDGGMKKLIDALGIKNSRETKELMEWLSARYIEGTRGHPQPIKDLATAGMLASPQNAAIQLQDVAGGARVAGGEALIQGLRDVAKGQGLTRQAAGLGDEYLDFTAGGKAHNFTKGSLKVTGFDTADAFGKEVILNSAINMGRNLIKENQGELPKFIMEWTRKLGSSKKAVGLVEELASGKIGPLTKEFALQKLAEIQPISMSEMPIRFLQAQSGVWKSFYSVKSYAIKQLANTRKELNAIVTGAKHNPDMTRGEAARRLAEYEAWFVSLGVPLEASREWWRGNAEDRDILDRVGEQFAISVGVLNRYSVNTVVERFGMDGLQRLVSSIILPAPAMYFARLGDKAAQSIEEGTPEPFLRELPVLKTFQGVMGD